VVSPGRTETSKPINGNKPGVFTDRNSSMIALFRHSGHPIIVCGMLRGLVVLGLAVIPHSQVCTAQDLRTVARELSSDLGLQNAPGKVLFGENWETGKWSDRWNPSDGWSVVRNPDGTGYCAKVVASHMYQNLRLKQSIPVEPGHPVAVFFRAKLLDGSAPVWLSAGAKDAAGKSFGGVRR
jgi:hypothetical protein